MYVNKLCKSSGKILAEADLMVKKLLSCVNAINWTLKKQEKVENLFDLGEHIEEGICECASFQIGALIRGK